MRVGICTVELYLIGVKSLKGKRSIIKSLITRLKNSYNVSVAEVDHQDLWQRSTLGLSMVSESENVIRRNFASILEFIEDRSEAQLLQSDIRIT